MDANTFKDLAAGLSIGLGAIGSAVGEGYLAGQALTAIGRNPEASEKIMPLMFVSMAVTESTSIYALVVSMIILFA